VAEGDAALLRGLARQREDVRHLMSLESGRRARPRPIGKYLEDQALELEVADATLLSNGQFRLTIQPSVPPSADRLGTHVELDRLLVVRNALPGQLHDLHPRDQLLRGLVAPLQLVENAPLPFCDEDPGGRPCHGGLPAAQVPRARIRSKLLAFSAWQH
jgi:hypothetical protein